MVSSSLFTPLTIGHITLANRFVRSATWEGLAEDDGSMTERLGDLIDELAKGGLGMIISGHAYVSREGQAGPWQLGVCDDSLIEDLTGLAAIMKQYGSRTVLQLAHAGGQAAEALTGTQARAPSPMVGRAGNQAREMTEDEISQTVQAFAAAADRAKQSGFDGVQIHAAHGFLLSQFLSPFYNRRTDAYGGSLENRARLLLETYAAIRAAVGDDFLVLVKINSEDFIDGGFSVDDMLAVCRMLETAGVDAIEMSGGTIAEESRYSACRTETADRPDEESYYREAARRYKETIGIPLILVGGIRSFEAAEQLVADGLADCISLCRPLIAEPGLVARWHSGDRAPSKCVSCNQCFGPAGLGEGIKCVLE